MTKTRWRPSYKELWQEKKDYCDKLETKVAKLMNQVQGLTRQVEIGDEEIGKLTQEIMELKKHT